MDGNMAAHTTLSTICWKPKPKVHTTDSLIQIVDGRYTYLGRCPYDSRSILSSSIPPFDLSVSGQRKGKKTSWELRGLVHTHRPSPWPQLGPPVC